VVQIVMPQNWLFLTSYKKQREEPVEAGAAGTCWRVPFDLAHWQQVAAERYPNGLPKPYSDDPTQWLFHGHPAARHRPAASRRRPPARLPLAGRDRCQDGTLRRGPHLDRPLQAAGRHADDDGIVCLPSSVRGENPPTSACWRC
jgi:hypothetical protein